MPPQFLPLLIIKSLRVNGHLFGQPQGSFFGGRKVATVFKISEIRDLVIAPAVPSCQDGVGSQSILATIDLRGAHNDQFLELGGDRAGIHYGTKMRDHGAQDFRAVSHGAEHVGNVTAFFLIGIEDFGGGRINLGPVQAGYSHIAILRRNATGRGVNERGQGVSVQLRTAPKDGPQSSRHFRLRKAQAS
jgi:hypothetical protein